MKEVCLELFTHEAPQLMTAPLDHVCTIAIVITRGKCTLAPPLNCLLGKTQ